MSSVAVRTVKTTGSESPMTSIRHLFVLIGLAGLFFLSACNANNSNETGQDTTRTDAATESATAQYESGISLSAGEGVAKDLTRAAELFEMAALRGHLQAQCELARSYSNGLGVVEDQVKAYAWFIIMSIHEDWDETLDCGLKKVRFSDTEQQRMKTYAFACVKQVRESGWGPSPAERIQAAATDLWNSWDLGPEVVEVKFYEDWGRIWTEELAYGKVEFRGGGIVKSTESGLTFQEGMDCRLDDEDVYRFEQGKWSPVRNDLTKGQLARVHTATQGTAEEQYELGLWFSNGDGGEQDYAQAAEWFEKAAWRGHAGAQCEMARAYAQGLGVAVDNVKALAWYSISTYPEAESKDKDCGVAEVLLTAPEIRQVRATALEWMKHIRATGWGPSPSERIQAAGAAFLKRFNDQSYYTFVDGEITFKDDWGQNTMESLGYGKAEFRNGGLHVTTDEFRFIDGTECRLDEETVYRFTDGIWHPQGSGELGSRDH